MWYNDNNLHYMAPFWSQDGSVLIVEAQQYDAWAQTDGLEILNEHFKEIVRSDEDVPKFPKETLRSDVPEWYYKVYHAIINRSAPERWYHAIPDAELIVLDDDLVHRLLESKYESHEARKEVSALIQEKMDLHMDVTPNGWFIKAGSHSTKYDYPPTDVYTGVEATEHIFNSFHAKREFLNKRTNCLLIRPWERRITDNNEVRVFVRDGKVTGVSQQACYKFVCMMALLDPNDVITACQKEYDSVSALMKPEHQMKYQCTFDAYFLTDEEAELSCHLIEINSECFGWGPAGAALFSWSHRPPPQPNEQPLYLVAGRY